MASTRALTILKTRTESVVLAYVYASEAMEARNNPNAILYIFTPP